MNTLTTLPIPTHTIICPECDGEGCFVSLTGPGKFDSSFGNWLPAETYTVCPCCGGSGELDLDDLIDEEDNHESNPETNTPPLPDIKQLPELDDDMELPF